MPVAAKRLNNLPPYVFATIGQKIREMTRADIDVLRLDIGSPDLPPAEEVIEALSRSAADEHKHGYSGYTGIAAFREAVAHYYQQRFNVTLNPDTEVLPLLGSKEGLVNLSLAYLDYGDVALVPDISYPSYSMGARLAGADIAWMPLKATNKYLPVVDNIPDDTATRAKILWLNYPNNPTGASAALDDYQRYVAYCQQHDILLASDNPYVEITYDGHRAGSVLQVPDALSCAVEFFSFSKTYNMAGWRLGAAVGNATIIKNLLHVKSNIDSGHFIPIYDAGIAALEQVSQDWIDARNAIYARRRDLILAALPDIGLRAHRPEGAIYIWAEVLDGDGLTYSREALDQAHVSLAPGGAYGPGGDRYVRISLCAPDEKIEAALDRLRDWYFAR